jgi:hypothetical protein
MIWNIDSSIGACALPHDSRTNRLGASTIDQVPVPPHPSPELPIDQGDSSHPSLGQESASGQHLLSLATLQDMGVHTSNPLVASARN